jgi:hypothetical protein
MDGITLKMDTREFDKTFKEYMDYSSRSLVESVNQHAFYIGRDCVNLTKAVDKSEIANELNAPSRDYPDVPLGAILMTMERKRRGLPGLNPSQKAREVEKFIRKRQRLINFLRAGWIPSIKILERIVPKKGGASLKGTKMKGQPKGGASPALKSSFNWSPMASIWNSIWKGENKTGKIMERGAQMAINMETKSMRTYIERKQVELCKKFWS